MADNSQEDQKNENFDSKYQKNVSKRGNEFPEMELVKMQHRDMCTVDYTPVTDESEFDGSP